MVALLTAVEQGRPSFSEWNDLGLLGVPAVQSAFRGAALALGLVEDQLLRRAELRFLPRPPAIRCGILAAMPMRPAAQDLAEAGNHRVDVEGSTA
ncbi:hypothetical protein [Micromonospora sp. DT233]|uniref:hypothetical protein n=1 Tax=Micromonospora sp. DT233 TaxID=3393432 RepID=UPI003CE91FEC